MSEPPVSRGFHGRKKPEGQCDTAVRLVRTPIGVWLDI
jgi:hypothetical protein